MTSKTMYHKETNTVSPARHSEGKYWKYVSWLVIFVFTAICFSILWSFWMHNFGPKKEDLVKKELLAQHVESWKIVVIRN